VKWSLFEIYNVFGICGLFIVLLGLFSIFVSTYIFSYTALVWKDFKKNFLSSDFELEKLLDSHSEKNPFLIIIRDIVSTHSSHSEDMRAEVSYLFYKNFKKVASGITWLKLISVISPLCGLLGTVIGMLSVFQSISADITPNPSVLAEGIWYALITTILGLIVAIPTLISFYLMSLRMKGFQIEAIEHSYRAYDTYRKLIHSRTIEDEANSYEEQ
jgi:biopolymer transport protein ExbB